MKPRTLVLYRLAYAVAVALTIVYASGNKGPQVPGAQWIPSFDKLAHFLVFGLMGTLLVRAIGAERLDWRRGLFAVAMVSLFGLSDELHQYTNPDRFFEVADWVADTLGAALAVALYIHWPWYRKVLETPLFRRRGRGEKGAAMENPKPE